MYDTMPADEPGWKADPFAGEILRVEPFVETLVARGARDPGS
jgi:acetylornithine deacetylase/succinyl-diaminopimelate desuccinylase-like protein